MVTVEWVQHISRCGAWKQECVGKECLGVALLEHTVDEVQTYTECT